MARNNDLEQTAKVCSAYFRPYCLHLDLASQHVPYVDALSDPKHAFHSSWKACVSGNILTLHMRRVIRQFLNVARVRCKDDILDTAEAKTIPPFFCLGLVCYTATLRISKNKGGGLRRFVPRLVPWNARSLSKTHLLRSSSSSMASRSGDFRFFDPPRRDTMANGTNCCCGRFKWNGALGATYEVRLARHEVAIGTKSE